MIGDLLGGSYHFTTFKNPSGMVGGPDGSLSIAGGDRREKISEDCSPLPTDRVFFDFNDFASAALTSDGHIIPVNRYTFGVKKTFFDGQCSVEIRAPVDSGLAADQASTNPTEANQGTVLGDISITPKVLIAKADTWAASAGMMMCLPAPQMFR